MKNKNAVMKWARNAVAMLLLAACVGAATYTVGGAEYFIPAPEADVIAVDGSDTFQPDDHATASEVCVTLGVSNEQELLEEYSIKVDDGVDADDCLQALAMLPRGVLDLFEVKNWSVAIGPGKVSELNEQYAVPANGWTIYAEKMIAINDERSVVHEFGHFLWWCLYREHGALIEQFYAEEAANVKEFIGAYSQTNEREYFAELFEYWVHNRQSEQNMGQLKELAPETYAFFEDMEDSGWKSDALGQLAA